MKNLFPILLLSAIILMLNTSFTKTSIAYKAFSLKMFENSMALVPKGVFHIGNCEEGTVYKNIDPCNVVEVDSFYGNLYRHK